MKKLEYEYKMRKLNEEREGIYYQLEQYKKKAQEQRQADAQRREAELRERQKGKFWKMLNTAFNPFAGAESFLSEVAGGGKSVINMAQLKYWQNRLEAIEREELELMIAEIEDERNPREKNRGRRSEILEQIDDLKRERTEMIIQLTDGRDPEDWTEDDRFMVVRLRNEFDNKINKLMNEYSQNI